MSVRGRWLSALPALLLLAAPVGAAVPPKPDPAAVDAAVRDALKAWGVPGAAVAVVRDGEVVYLKGHGVREAGRDRPVTPDTVFPLASCTKAFTTAVMGMLVDDGKLSWDDPVRKHLDWFHLSDPLADRDVTLRDLVTHRTGLRGHDMLWYRSPYAQEQVIRRLALLPLDRPFRTTFQYQSTMFTAAGLAAGAAAKSTWADLVRTRLLVPLDMTGASLTTTEAEKAPDRAMPHRPGPDGRPQVISWYPQETPDAAGSLNASARDLTGWLMFQLDEGRYKGNRLVSAEALRETHTPQIVLRADGINRDLNPETNLSSYGMAWRIQDYRGTLMLSHAGAIDGFRAEIILLPKERIGIALLCNLNQSRINLALGNTLADLFLGLPRKDWDGYFLGVVKKEQAASRQSFVKRWGERDVSVKPSLPLPAYEGFYEHPAYGKARVSAEGGGLVLRWGRFKWSLAYYRGDTFLVSEDFFGETAVTFEVRDGRATAMTLAEPFGVEFKKK
ncbi:MAG TPA: serine hydrolase [Gemmataceae bacterium]|nr:serine hydrolase [Gemmataceae bacterium]